MSLQLGQDVGGISVRLVLSQLELLVHPQQQLICITLKLLQTDYSVTNTVVLKLFSLHTIPGRSVSPSTTSSTSFKVQQTSMWIILRLLEW